MKDEMLNELDKDYERKNLSKQEYIQFRSEIIAKADQLTKLVEDHNSGKVDEATFTQWYEAISQDYKEIGERKRNAIDKNIEARKKKAENKYRRPFIIGFLIVIGIVGGYWLVTYLYENRSINDVPEPVQVMLSDEEAAEEHIVYGKDIGRPDYTLKMKYLASYDIKGIVLGTKHFDDDGTSFDKSFPVDVGLAWGEAASHRGLLDCTNGPRKLSCKYDLKRVTNETEAGRRLIDLVSNNHLSPADKDIYRKLMSIQKGNYIELKGYLVSMYVEDGSGDHLEAVSSLFRDDHMDSIFDTTATGCEIMYVTSVEWLD